MRRHNSSNDWVEYNNDDSDQEEDEDGDFWNPEQPKAHNLYKYDTDE